MSSRVLRPAPTARDATVPKATAKNAGTAKPCPLPAPAPRLPRRSDRTIQPVPPVQTGAGQSQATGVPSPHPRRSGQQLCAATRRGRLRRHSSGDHLNAGHGRQPPSQLSRGPGTQTGHRLDAITVRWRHAGHSTGARPQPRPKRCFVTRRFPSTNASAASAVPRSDAAV